MKELEYPFDANYILKKRRLLKKNLLAQNDSWLDIKIAILGGSTTHDVKEMMELFLLNQGIRAVFYESEYNQFYEDALFGNAELDNFYPDIIYIHTTSRNITNYPCINDDLATIKQKLEDDYAKFESIWIKLEEKFGSIIVQNNFELPYYRTMGNMEFADSHGRVNFVNELNARLALYARDHERFYINDINYLSACYGLDRWLDPFYYHMYKYALAVPAIPELAFNLSNIIKSIYGKNKKVLTLDLDNTLWGGIIGDDGVENIQIGQETSEGQVFSAFQKYIKELESIGVLLTIDSKNEEKNALNGLKREDSILKVDDFVAVKANWNPKDINLVEIADMLNLGIDSFVFVDDNPAERTIVEAQLPEVAVPSIGEPSEYIHVLDRSGFFEVTTLSKDDAKRSEMYKANAKRKSSQALFEDYTEYLKSLKMKATICAFDDMYMQRIAQLTNKSNQFNLTTVRCTQADIERIAEDPNYITLRGKLEDRFGDNGVVSVVYGHIDKNSFHIDLWLMSCRVLKRNMEYAMMDVLVNKCSKKGIETIYGYYYPTAKNSMVAEFYSLHGFEKIAEEKGSTKWKLNIREYEYKNPPIEIIE